MGWFSKFVPWRRRAIEEQDLSEELQFHFDMEVSRLRAFGLSELEARAAARRELGSLALAAESTRETRRFSALEGWFRDLALGHRLLVRNPGVSLLALVVIAAGVAANTLVFAVLKNVVLDPPPYQAPHRLYILSGKNARSDSELRGALSLPDAEDLERRSRTIESLGAFQAFAMSDATVVRGDTASTVGTTVVTGNFFRTMGVAPRLGRFIEPSDDKDGNNHVAVVSEGFWRSHLGARGNVLGEELRLNGESFEIIGVMPASFRFPLESQDVWLPMSSLPQDSVPSRLRIVRWLSAVARAKPGYSREVVAEELSGIAAALAVEFPDSNRDWTGILLQGLQEHLTGENRLPLLILFASVVLLLLLGTANLSSLLLSKAFDRQQEFAARAALGASRTRLIRQVVLENAAICFYGGLLGTGLAYACFAGLRNNPIPGLEQLQRAEWDAGIAGFVAAVLLVLPLGIGILPALHSTRSTLSRSLGAAAWRSTTGSAGVRTQRGLVVLQVTLAVVLCVAFALLMRSLGSLLSVDPGFDSQRLLVAQFALPSWKYEGRTYLDGLQRMLEMVRALPGVESAATIKKAPLTGLDEEIALHPPGYDKSRRTPGARLHPVTPGYFATMKIPLLAGRDFTDADRQGAEGVVIVNEAYVRQYAPGDDLLGKRLRAGRDGGGPAIRVVGVAKDVHFKSLQETPAPAAYVPVLQVPRVHVAMMIRTKTEPLALASAVRDAIRGVDREQAMEEISTMDAILARASLRPRLLTATAGLFATSGVFLAALGVYGAISFLFARRTKELGIRVALGASPGGVAAILVRTAIFTAVAGIACGLALSAMLATAIRSELFGISALDPIAFGVSAALLLAICVGAAVWPAIRARRLQPATVLREQ